MSSRPVLITSIPRSARRALLLATLILLLASAAAGQREANLSSHAEASFKALDPIFAPVVTYGTGGSGIPAIAVGDVNGDGKPDLVVTNGPQTGEGELGVLLGNGDGTFQPVLVYSSGGAAPSAVALQDLNGDGILDLAIANQCDAADDCSFSTVGVLLGNGDGTFRPAVNYASGGFQSSTDDAVASSIMVGDVNGDGIPDLVVASECGAGDLSCPEGTVGVLLGNGDGTFRPVVAYGSAGDWTSSVAIGDVNGDGKLDIVLANCGSIKSGGCSRGLVAVLLNNGDGTFQKAVPYATGSLGALSVTLADLHRDGKLDILVGNLCSSHGTGCLSNPRVEGSVGVLLGNGDGTFQPAVVYESGADGARSVAVADVNLDGNLDLVVSGCNRHIGCGPATASVLLGNGNGTFQPQAMVYPGGVGSSFFLPLAVGDLTGSGSPDLVIGSSDSVGILVNNSRQ